MFHRRYTHNEGFLPLHDPVATEERVRQGMVDVVQYQTEGLGVLATVGALSVAAIKALMDIGRTPEQAEFEQIQEEGRPVMVPRGRPRDPALFIEFGENPLTHEQVMRYLEIEGREIANMERDIAERKAQGKAVRKLETILKNRREVFEHVQGGEDPSIWKGEIQRILGDDPIPVEEGPEGEPPALLPPNISDEEMKAYLEMEPIFIDELQQIIMKETDPTRKSQLEELFDTRSELLRMVRGRSITGFTSDEEFTRTIREILGSLFRRFQRPASATATKPIKATATATGGGRGRGAGLTAAAAGAMQSRNITEYRGFTDQFSEIQRQKDQAWLNSMPDSYMDRVNGQLLDLMSRPIVSPSLERIKNGGLLPANKNTILYDKSGQVAGVPVRNLKVSNGGEFSFVGSLGGEREQFGYLPDYRRDRY